jgi:single-strand DNA-binding protein
MFDTPLTVVGRIVTDPKRRMVGDQEVIRFRVASNSRRRNGEGTWEPGNSLFITVNCWGKLVTGVGAALGKGAPVIVVGNVYTSEYEDREGVRRSSLEMRATAVGPDLSRAIVRIEKSAYTGIEPAHSGAVGSAPAAPDPDAGDADGSSEEAGATEELTGAVAAPGGGALSLSA